MLLVCTRSVPAQAGIQGRLQQTKKLTSGSPPPRGRTGEGLGFYFTGVQLSLLSSRLSPA